MTTFGKIIVSIGIAGILALLLFGGQWLYKKGLELKTEPEVRTDVFENEIPADEQKAIQEAWCLTHPKACKG